MSGVECRMARRLPGRVAAAPKDFSFPAPSLVPLSFSPSLFLSVALARRMAEEERTSGRRRSTHRRGSVLRCLPHGIGIDAL